MTKLTWGAVGERVFEAGVDRGVLYVGTNAGVPWNGLVAVKESPSGGTSEGFYYDGVKYRMRATPEEFVGTIEALSSPAEFGPCDGTNQLAPGLFVTQQPRREFNFSYRTLIGDDVDGLDRGYRVHLVYNALAKPPSRTNATLNASAQPGTLSWEITTRPPLSTGYRPSAHLSLDSRLVMPSLMAQIEDILYGTPTTAPRMPTQQELVDLLT